jgi:hypothetical protein
MLHSSIEAASILSFVCVKIGAVFQKDFKKNNVLLRDIWGGFSGYQVIRQPLQFL